MKKGKKKNRKREKKEGKTKQNKTKSLSITREMPTCCAMSSVRQSDMVYPENGFGAGSIFGINDLSPCKADVGRH